ncbi:hypothetical protein FSARC_14631 [Fusarium sarcochroum]|uniref:Protein kinase domain-containing protein n=1 Tax=Fusarium sarcochroum TaxID=1208366 RepID=A0A8H4SRU0_9HYPO|nr:hypothetical protein FSARC_14631 [Fusarium sarcochroum]
METLKRRKDAEMPVTQSRDTARSQQTPPTKKARKQHQSEADDPSFRSECLEDSPAAPLSMEICEICERWKEEGDEVAFDHIRLVVKISAGQFFYADTHCPVEVPPGHTIDLGQLSSTFDANQHVKHQFATFLASELGLNELNLIPIPDKAIWPFFSSSFTRAPENMSQHFYIKRAHLQEYDETDGEKDRISQTVLEEAKVYEILRNSPHPNIAKYWGCEVVDGTIHGLCLGKYDMTLYDRIIDTEVPLDVDKCLQAIKAGIFHLHSLGLAHNDINPSNIMIDEGDNPIIIDFDSCRHEGEELIKYGTPDWCFEGMQYASRENDLYGLSKMEEFLNNPPRQEEDAQDEECVDQKEDVE